MPGTWPANGGEDDTEDEGGDDEMEEIDLNADENTQHTHNGVTHLVPEIVTNGDSPVNGRYDEDQDTESEVDNEFDFEWDFPGISDMESDSDEELFDDGESDGDAILLTDGYYEPLLPVSMYMGDSSGGSDDERDDDDYEEAAEQDVEPANGQATSAGHPTRPLSSRNANNGTTTNPTSDDNAN